MTEERPVQLLTSVQVEAKTVNWSIENVNKCPVEEGECIESPIFCTGSNEVTEWCLRFYPRCRNYQENRSAAMYLYKVTPGTRVHVEVRLILGTLVPTFCNEEEDKIYSEAVEIGTKMVLPQEQLKHINHLLFRCKLTVGTLPAAEDEDYRKPSCSCAMSADLAKLYSSQQFTDAVLQVDKKQFRVHRAVLAARSKVFFAMFERSTEENGIFSIEKVCPFPVNHSIMADILRYIYTGKAEGLDVNKAIKMLEVADAFALLELKDLCSYFLLEHMSVDNACSIAVMADMHSETGLRNAAMRFIRSHSAEVFDRGEWGVLTEERPLLATNILKEIAINFKTDCGKKKISFEEHAKK